MSLDGVDEALADFDFFFETVESVHPRPMALMTPEQYLRFKGTLRDFARRTAAAGALTVGTMAALLARAAAGLRDSHTLVALEELGSEVLGARPGLPFRFVYQAGRIRIAETVADLEDLRGGVLRGINGIEFDQFAKPALSRISGDSDHFRLARFADLQGLFWCFTPAIEAESVEVEVDGATESIRRQVPLLDWRQFAHRFGGAAFAPENRLHRHGGGVFRFRYDDFLESDLERRKIDEMVRLLRRERAASLLIDLRFSGGGSSKMADFLLRRLTRKPFRLYSRVDVRLSPQLLESGRHARLAELTGQTAIYRAAPAAASTSDDVFEGGLFVLTGPRTFSAAADLAAAVKDFELGTVLGETTGGVRESFGDSLRFVTPHSKIAFAVSCKQYHAPLPGPGDETAGTTPHARFDPIALERHRGDDDPELAFALASISDLS